MEFFGFLFGIVVFLVALRSINNSQRNKKIAKKSNRDARSSGIITIKAATIADDMLPLIDQIVESGFEVTITGHDAYYIISKNGKRWREGLENWLSKGVSVNYIVNEVSNEIHQFFQNLTERYPGNFKVYEIRQSPESEPLLKKYKELHPTLITNGTERAMWVEYFHPANSEFAYNVNYVSPVALNGKWAGEYEEYEAELNELKKLAA